MPHGLVTVLRDQIETARKRYEAATTEAGRALILEDAARCHWLIAQLELTDLIHKQEKAA